MGTMRIPGVGVPFWGRLLLLLYFLAASESRLVQACPGLITSGCSCTDERSKAHTTTSVRKRVSCSGEELSETPQASLLPNRTVTLILSRNRIRVLRNGSFAGLGALEKLPEGLRLSPDARARRRPIWILPLGGPVGRAARQQGGFSIIAELCGKDRVITPPSVIICKPRCTVQDKGIIGRKGPLAAFAALRRRPRRPAHAVLVRS
ncbi:hypothetical protein SKAU_G00007540 [Synaphobranchus kaupii]|uniref:Uncharacterized protein n=1 Tax=Synaphobranchus kaupii TaxID=118154 RepID=A0A9Q1JAV8_SYNKA|nr:hypothetical protein SKAU_G00007540 [Synaphobranchus kaupii]